MREDILCVDNFPCSSAVPNGEARPRLFCFSLPEQCPVCHAYLSLHQPLTPFRLPFPFVKASQHPYAVVIRPTIGRFLIDFEPRSDLHIGVTNGRGEVIHFKEEGLVCDSRASEDWLECLKVYQLEEEDEEWKERWDAALILITSQSKWNRERYNETNFNCYSFALDFLKFLDHPRLRKAVKNKNTFCEEFVVRVTENAYKYIKLYRTLRVSKSFLCNE